MMKRMMTLALAVIMALGMMIPAAMAGDNTATTESGYYYVYTENGKGLNVRETPGGRIVGSLKYGTRIHVDAFTDDTWALIIYNYEIPGYGKGDYAAFVNRRFLQKNKPADRTETSTTKKAVGSASDTIEDLNKEFASAKQVTPYKVVVRPTRASGWVNMRWAPSQSSELMATYRANDTLLVIKELNNWLQVEDQDTGDVGFINKAFVSQ